MVRGLDIFREYFADHADQFVLIGGNDGWIGSENALDQVPLWLKGEYIRMPLRPETVAREFPVVTVLGP